MSQLDEIAKAVVDEIVEAFKPTYLVKRAYVPIYDLKEIGALRVTVIGRGDASEAISRATTDDQYAIDVGIQKKLDPEQSIESQVDACLEVVQGYKDFFRLRRLTKADAVWIGQENDPVYFPDHLLHDGVFTSVLTLYYRVLR